MARFVKVAGAQEVAPGAARQIEVEGKSIALFNIEGRFYAIEAWCYHMGAPLVESEYRGGSRIVCPWHGWEFDLTTGCYTRDKTRRLQVFPVKVEGEHILIEI